MEILDNSRGYFHIKLRIRNKSDNFIWSLVSIYGAAQDVDKPAFLKKLVNLAKDNPHPIITSTIPVRSYGPILNQIATFRLFTSLYQLNQNWYAVLC
jgi:hypothetical protein